MELKDCIKLIKQEAKTFLGVVAIVVLMVCGYFVLRSVAYNTSLMINIGRDGSQETSDYKYDDFYRMQADEKFAETIVEWISSPSIEVEILNRAGVKNDKLSMGQLTKTLKAEKRSSNVVMIYFSTSNAQEAQKISVAAVDILNKNVDSIRGVEKSQGWFKIIAHDPIIIQAGFNMWIVLVVSFLGGCFIAFWLILIIHYLRQ